jgi:Phage integrase family
VESAAITPLAALAQLAELYPGVDMLVFSIEASLMPAGIFVSALEFHQRARNTYTPVVGLPAGMRIEVFAADLLVQTATAFAGTRIYTKRFGTAKPEWFVFPGRIGKPVNGKQRPLDPTRPISTLKTAWKNVKKQVGVKGRFHDTRHTLITELAESGAGDQTIMDIAGHVSRQILARYSHIRMEAKRKALEAIEAKPQPVKPEQKQENAGTEEGTIQ